MYLCAKKKLFLSAEGGTLEVKRLRGSRLVVISAFGYNADPCWSCSQIGSKKIFI